MISRRRTVIASYVDPWLSGLSPSRHLSFVVGLLGIKNPFLRRTTSYCLALFVLILALERICSALSYLPEMILLFLIGFGVRQTTYGRSGPKILGLSSIRVLSIVWEAKCV
jgi:hypothetical protein